MVSERLKNELTELRARMLDIREFESLSPENLKCLCDSIKNIQAVVTEMLLQQADAHMPHPTMADDGEEKAETHAGVHAGA